jgi:hypothetical protein
MVAKNPENNGPEEGTNTKSPKQTAKKKQTRSKTAAAKKSALKAAATPEAEAAAKTQTSKKSKRAVGSPKKPRTSSKKKSVRKADAGPADSVRPSPEAESTASELQAQGGEDQLAAVDTEHTAKAEIPPAVESGAAPRPPAESTQPDQESTSEVPSEITAQPEAPQEESRPSETPLSPTLSDSAIQAPHKPEPLPAVVKYLIGGLAFLIALIVLTSYQNMQKYYVVAQHGALEIWKGDFSPMGRELVVIMPGVLAPDQTKEVYTREEIFPIVFHYYMDKADALLDVPGAPDFIDINDYLNRASEYAVTDEMRSAVKSSLNNIDRIVLLYKADAAAGRGTIEDLASARQYLNQAAALSPNEPEANLIQQKIESVEKQIDSLRSQEAQEATEAPAPENPSAEAPTPDTPEVSPESPPASKTPQNKEQSF